jgi:hypothetical protein
MSTSRMDRRLCLRASEVSGLQIADLTFTPHLAGQATEGHGWRYGLGSQLGQHVAIEQLGVGSK